MLWILLVDRVLSITFLQELKLYVYLVHQVLHNIEPSGKKSLKISGMFNSSSLLYSLVSIAKKTNHLYLKILLCSG